MNQWKIQAAVNVIRQGGVIAYPTEGVWGLGCDPNNNDAVLRLLHIKQRDVNKGLILVASSLSQLLPFLDAIPENQLQMITPTWPGPATWTLNASSCSPLLRGEHDTLAVRVSNHPTIVNICNSLGMPLVSTSANRQGKPPAMSQLQVRRYFNNQLDFILSGKLGTNTGPTPIRDAQTGRYLRTYPLRDAK